jgi:hypothetical protein
MGSIIVPNPDKLVPQTRGVSGLAPGLADPPGAARVGDAVVDPQLVGERLVEGGSGNERHLGLLCFDVIDAVRLLV